MTRSLSRRRLLAAGVPALLAGCLVESGESGDGPGGDGTDGGATDTGSEETVESDGDGADTDDSTAGQTEDGESGDGQSDGGQTDEESVPDPVGPDASGLVVTSAEVLGVSDDGAETTVDARLTVENRGRFTYGTVEFRVDAYATVPNTNERDEVGFAYVTRRFLTGDRFEDGTRRFDVSITFRSSETNVRSDTDWYRVDAAVRRADPV